MKHASPLFRATVVLAAVAISFPVGLAASASVSASGSALTAPTGECDWFDPAAVADLPVAEAAANLTELSTLTAAVNATDLAERLEEDGPFTIFAPSNDAFDAIPQNVFDSIVADLALLTSILEYHVVVGERLTAEELVAAGTVETLNGPLEITADGSALVVNGQAMVTCAGIQTGDATIFVIDRVLQPAAGGIGTDGSSIPGSSQPLSSVPGSSIPG